ncbi:MAG: Gfo/Idh/MocA family oxidoreductase [Candidatus Latescibacteria bacterium]|nr:Gfo/Idh/MocA family oxidoreductase [Candidatus Latescibacterota bacterium]
MGRNLPTRRSFIKTITATTGVLSVGGLIPSFVLGANDRINYGVIGTGGRGTGLLRELVNRSGEENIQVKAVCDVFQKRLTEAKDICKGDGYMDYRKILDRNDIDAVLIAAPDHWHSKMCIEAMDAGKHVYCEKPLTLTCEQAIEVRDAVKKYNKVLQVGPQRTAQDRWWNARDIIRDGRLGKVTWAQGSWNRNNRGRSVFGTSDRRDDPVGPHMTGENYIDWDMWLGHKWGLAPRVPWNPNRFFYFRGYWDYNGGVATDLLYHFLAPLLLAIVGEDGEYPVRVNGNGGLYDNNDGREVPDVFMMTVDYPGKFTVFLESVLTNEYYRPARIYGRYGTMEFDESLSDISMEGVGSFMDKFREMNNDYEKMIIPPTGGRRDMHGNFIDVIRKGGKLNCNVNLGASTMVAIKMGVESYRQKKTMLWNAVKEKMIAS